MLWVWAGAVLALMVGGSVTGWLPAAWFPDLGLLLAVALGLYRPGASGIFVAWGIGWSEDVLYAAPLGEHALLRMLAWSLTRVAVRSIQVQHLGILLVLVVLLTLGDALLRVALAKAFGSVPGLDPALLMNVFPRMIVNALAIAWVSRLVQRALGDSADPAAGRGTLRLEPRSPSL